MLESDGGVQPSMRTQGGMIMLPEESTREACLCSRFGGSGIELKEQKNGNIS